MTFGLGYQLAPGSETSIQVPIVYSATWTSSVPPSTDPKAAPFGIRPFNISESTIRPIERPAPAKPDKPVLYVPVKRSLGKDARPKLTCVIQLSTATKTSPPEIGKWRGGRVEIEVVNLLKDAEGKTAGILKLPIANLDDSLRCEVEIPDRQLEAWLSGTDPLDAKVNENLFDFRFTLLDVVDRGRTVRGQSANRIFLYCRKTLVFLPGLFASRLEIPTPSGDVVGFPDFWTSDFSSTSRVEEGLRRVSNILNVQRGSLPSLNQRVDVLECDSDGEPLVEVPKPKLLRLGGKVIEPFEDLRRAREKVLPAVPSEFRLYGLAIFPYDWRCDLTNTAAALRQELGRMQDRLRATPDNDDRVAIMGHSTGGVVIRRALADISPDDLTFPKRDLAAGLRKADELIEHAFFLSVPFSGAPKAAAVLLTGLEMPAGRSEIAFLKRQIPFIDPESLVGISLSLPIVYHLHTSTAYPYRPLTSISRPPGSASIDIEADKRTFVEDVLQEELMPRPWIVDAAKATTKELRQDLAFNGSIAWHRLVQEDFELRRKQSYELAWQGTSNQDEWFEREVRRRGLEKQRAARTRGGWNPTLAARAARFHEVSQTAIDTFGRGKITIFWGSCPNVPTLRQLNLEARTSRPIKMSGPVSLEMPLYATADGTEDERHRVPREARDVMRENGRGDYVRNEETFTAGRITYQRWRPTPGGVVLRSASLSWFAQKDAGDETVPADSQWAEAWKSSAQREPNAVTRLTSQEGSKTPTHMASPLSHDVWSDIIGTMHDGRTQGDHKSANVRHAKVLATLESAPLELFHFV